MKKSIAKKVIVPMAGIVLISAFAASWAISALQARRSGDAARREAAVAEANLLDTLTLAHEQLVSRMGTEMRVLQSEARRMGMGRPGPAVGGEAGRAPDLLFGRVSQATLLAQLESAGPIGEGSVSILSRSGGDLVRLATGIFRPDGSPAVGSRLDPASAPFRALAKGLPYWGPLDLSGALFYTYYEPVRDAAGTVIGAFGIEYPLDRFSRIYQSMSRVKILDQGFLALVGQDGVPVFSGSPLGAAATRELLGKGTVDGARWAVLRQPFGPWGVTVLAAYPVARIAQAAWLFRWAAMGVALGLVGALTLTYYLVLRENLLRPLGDVLSVLDMVTFYKRYELRFRQDNDGEIGALSASLNNMLEQIQFRDAKLLDYQEHLEELVAQRLDQLLQTQQLLSSTLDALPVFIAILDGAGTILVTNRQWQQAGAHAFMAGAGPGTDHLALCRALAAERAELREAAGRIAEVIQGAGETVRLDYDLELDGRRECFTVLATRFEARGTPRTVLMHMNVTDQRLMEIQLRQAQKLESIGQLAAGIAHEINTPTQFIGDNTIFLRQAFQELWLLVEPIQRLLDEARDGAAAPDGVQAARLALERADLGFLAEEIPRAIGESLEGVRRVSSIVKAMKDFSHPGGSSRIPTDLNRALESTVLVCRSEWKYVAEMELDLEPELAPVPCFPDEINQVILNLVINSAHAIAEAPRAGQDKGLIRISSRRVDGAAQISVADSGCGIPEAIRSRVFDPFFTTKPVGKGTGQGLALAYAIITEHHGGTIALESEVGKGTTFTIRLPYPTPDPVSP